MDFAQIIIIIQSNITFFYRVCVCVFVFFSVIDRFKSLYIIVGFEGCLFSLAGLSTFKQVYKLDNE